MKTDELVISEDYRYYVTREGKLAVLMCDLTKVPVDVPFEMLDGKDVFVFFLPDQVKTEEVTLISCYQGGRFCGIKNSDDIVGCLYFASGYKEAKLELKANHGRQFVCCDESDVVGAIYDPKTGMASWYDPHMKPALSGHSLAKSIAESIARGDGKWLEATSQSLQSRREAVQRRIDEREFPQYWTPVGSDSDRRVAFILLERNGRWWIHDEAGDRMQISSLPWSAEGRTRLTKEQAEAFLDKPVKDADPRKPYFKMVVPEVTKHLCDGDFFMRVEGDTITWIKQ